MFKTTTLFLIFILLIKLNAQTNSTENDSTSEKSFDWMAYPYIMYTPETNLAFGGGGIIYFRTQRKENILPSQVTFSAYYTINNQFSTFIEPIIYFNDNKDEIGGEFYLAHKIDKFYGAGSQTPDISNPQFNFSIAQVSLNFKRNFYDVSQIILLFEYTRYKVIDKLENPILKNSSVVGNNGGTDVGIGVGYNLDNRDNIFFPSSGFYVDFFSMFYLENLGSDFKYNKFVLDSRYYQSIFDADKVLAVQFYTAFTTGNTPFYSMPKLGGAWQMRGYYEGRFRDKAFSTLQLEFRSKIYWKIGGTLFASIGEVGTTLEAFRINQFKYAYGFGLRFMFDEKERINLRLDVAFGKNTSGFYLGIKEAF